MCIFKELLPQVFICWFVLMHPKDGKTRKPSNPILGQDRGVEAQRNRGEKGRGKGKKGKGRKWKN